MIWATVGSWSCFCWLYRVSPSLASKNIINLSSVLAIWWCPCVESSLVLLEEGVCYDVCSLGRILLACYCRCFLTSDLSEKMQIKTTRRYFFTPVRMTITKKTTDNKCWQGYGERESLYTVDGNISWCSHCGNQWTFL